MKDIGVYYNSSFCGVVGEEVDQNAFKREQEVRNWRHGLLTVHFRGLTAKKKKKAKEMEWQLGKQNKEKYYFKIQRNNTISET